MAETKRKDYTINKIDKNRYEIEVTIPAKVFQEVYEGLLAKATKDQKVKGFREGMAPKELIEQQVGSAVLQQTFEQVAPYFVSNVIYEEKLHIVAPPTYTDLPKNLLLGTPIKFKVTVVTMPEFKLGNLKNIQLKKENTKPEEKEVEKTLEEMFKNRPNSKKFAKMTDAWAKDIAKLYKIEKVESLDDLRKAISQLITKEKERVAIQLLQQDALNQAIKLCKIEIPEEAVTYEAHQRQHSLEHQLKASKTTLEDYCKTVGTTPEQLHQQFHKDAQQALETDVFLNLYAKEKNIKVTEEELEAEIAKTKDYYKQRKQNVDPKVFEDPQWQAQIKSVLLKQKAFQAFIKETVPEELIQVKSEKTSKKEKKTTKGKNNK